MTDNRSTVEVLTDAVKMLGDRAGRSGSEQAANLAHAVRDLASAAATLRGAGLGMKPPEPPESIVQVTMPETVTPTKANKAGRRIVDELTAMGML